MPGKDNENGLMGMGFHMRPPSNKTKWQEFQQSIYDPSTQQVCGRNAKNWGQLLLFYTIFYIFLAALFAACMQGLLASLDDDAPKWQLEDSLIGTNPGLGFRPISDETEEGSLIWFNNKNRTTADKWVKILDRFLESYSGNQTGKNFENCDFGKGPSPGKVCRVDLKNFKACGPDNKYGYHGGSPCVFLKLNKIFGWKPQFYRKPEADMPEDLKTAISNLPDNETEQVWISCQGEGPVDKEHVSEFDYFPSRGFSGYYFPYINTPDYLSPLIAVQIKNIRKNVIVSIECRSWARNIKYRGGELQREGSIHFELLIDDPPEVKNSTTANSKSNKSV